MANDDIQNLLRIGIQAAQSGNQAAAHRILEQVIEQAPDNELAWIWMASVAETAAERRACLQKVLDINPGNTRARQALDKLQRMTPAASPARRSESPGPAPDSNLRSPTRTRAVRTAELERDALLKAHSRRRQRSLPPLLFTLIALLAVAMIAAGLLLLWNNGQPDDDAAPTTPPAAAVGGAATPVTVIPGVYVTPTPIGGVLRTLPPRETLPPTWTPTATWTPSATPPPTATPLPLSAYTLIVSFRPTGDINWELYTMRADGSQKQRVSLRLPPAPEGSEITLLHVRDAAFSPDRQRVALTGQISESWLDGDTQQTGEYEELFVAPAAGGTIERLTEQHASAVEAATWSPDGQQIAFASDADGDFDVYVIPAEGGTPGLLTRDHQAADRYPAWSPDGAYIAFASDRNSPGELEVFRLDVATSAIKQLTDNVNSSYAPAWSPDSQSIVFLSNRLGNTDLYVMTANGDGERALLVRDVEAEERDPAWSPDGEWIAFSSNRAGPVLDLFMIHPDSSGLQRITPGDGDTRYPAWQP